MHEFLTLHIDAIIAIVFGLGLTIYSLRQRARLQASPNRFVRALPILSPVIIAFGILQLFVAPSSNHSWQRTYTNDQRASAEFPSAPTTKENTESAQGISIRTSTTKCNIPQRGIDLILSYNGLPPEAPALTAEQRRDAILDFFVQQGFAITSCVSDPHGDVPGYRIVLDQNQGKARCLIRIAFTPRAIYRTLATSTSGNHDDPAMTHFIDSFRLE